MKDKIQRMRLALALSGIMVNDTAAEIIVRVVDVLDEKGDNFSVKYGAEIENKVIRKFTKKKLITEKQ